jgi:hypothetical protein
MKNTTLAIVAALALAALALPADAASRNDFKVIQNAVKKEPAAEAHRELRWFKVVIEDGRPRQAAIKITLPIGLIEALLSSADCRHFKLDDDRCEIDVKAVWKALKKAGSTALVEIQGDDGAVIKVWLE